jgi:membrane protein implicated in regulation of membrane protease activity
MDIAIIDWFILIAILIGLVALLIIDWGETIDFVLVIGLMLLLLFLGYSLIRDL